MRAGSVHCALLIAACLLGSGRAAAYPITVDGNVGDWLLSGSTALPLNDNIGHLARGSSQTGEYTWRDATGDQVAGIDDDIDIQSFHITATATTLYFRIAMVSLATNPNRYPQVQIAIDRTNSSGSGVRSFGRGCTDQTGEQGAWEYLVVTRFGSAGGGSHTPFVYDTGLVDRGSGGATAAMSTTTNNIEIGVPWSSIGGVPSYRVHFTVISIESDRSDNTRTTAASDAVTSYGHPAIVGNTSDERSDGVIDYRFDVWFHLDPEYDPAAPLVISELLAEPASGDPDDEWIEIFNATGSTIGLASGYRLGDEEVVGEVGTDAMYEFPSGATIEAGAAQVVAVAADHYFAQYARNPRYEFVASDPAVVDMVRDTSWTSGPVLALGASDQVLLLDDHFTIIDAVVWGTTATQYPGVTAAAAAAAGSSLERTLVHRDTNNCATDFAYQASPTPGAAAAPCRNGLGGNLPDGRPCNNGDPCVAGTCSAGACVDGTRRACAADGDECTDDVCDSAFGDCYPPTAAGTACSDDDPLDCLAAQCDGSGSCDQTFDSEPAGAACDASLSAECHVARCDGAGGCDPTYSHQSSGADCADATSGDCWTAACDGAGACDQAYGPQLADTPCDDSDLFNCLVAQCDASGTCDQMHFPEPPGAPCQDLDPGDCIAAACNASGRCDQAFGIAGSDVICRPSAGVCDATEFCDGNSDTCPDDARFDATQVCRPEVPGGCDVADFCDGSGDNCPADAKRDPSTVCRGAFGTCDLAEQCSGVDDACPIDLFAADTVDCDDGNACTLDTHCNGAGACVPGTVICDAGWLPDAAGRDTGAADGGAADGTALDRRTGDVVGLDLVFYRRDGSYQAAPIESVAGCGCVATDRAAPWLTLAVVLAWPGRRRRAGGRGRRRAR